MLEVFAEGVNSTPSVDVEKLKIALDGAVDVEVVIMKDKELLFPSTLPAAHKLSKNKFIRTMV